MISRFLILLVLFIFVVTKIGSVLMRLCSLKILCVGNNNKCHIVGVGSVKFKTHDGMTRTLKGAKHIPSMARNLISLSTLDCDWYKYAGGNKRLKVSKGSFIYDR